MEEEEETKPEDVPLPPDDPYETTSYNQNWLNFLQKFETYKTNEYKMEENPLLFKHLPTIEPIKNNTLTELYSLRDDIFSNLYDKYLADDIERKKILANKDGYKPFDTSHEDVEDFIRLSKNISQLEKGIYTEENKEMMFLLGEKETTPTANTLKKILEFLKEKKYPLLFSILAATLIGLFVDLEKGINKIQKKVKEEIVKQVVKKAKSQLQLALLRTQSAILEATKRYYFIIILLTVVFYFSRK